MGSSFGLMMEDAWGSLMETHMERDLKVSYVPPTGEPFVLESADISPVSMRQILKPLTGELVLREFRTVLTPRVPLAAKKVDGLQIRAKVKIDDEEWHVVEDETNFGEALVMLGIVRKPLAAMNESRDANNV